MNTMIYIGVRSANMDYFYIPQNHTKKSHSLHSKSCTQNENLKITQLFE